MSFFPQPIYRFIYLNLAVFYQLLTYSVFSYLLKYKAFRVDEGLISVTKAFSSIIIQFTQTIGAC